jgi:diguanylate cyclase (GGDEF)-like protein/PAS domain S-box-containing protein
MTRTNQIALQPAATRADLAPCVGACRLPPGILQSLPVSVIATGIDGDIISANQAAERLLGYPRHELTGQPTLLIHDAEELRRRQVELAHKLGVRVANGFELIVAAASRDWQEEIEWTYLRKDGRRVPVRLAVSSMRNEAGDLAGFLMVAHDITAHKRADAYIRRVAHYDALTGLPNRALLLDRLGMAIQNARRRDEMFAVLMLDLDHFKQVNDSLGHHVGDALLRSVGRRIQQCLRDVDVVARFGGDEFVILLDGVPTREQLAGAVGGIMEAVSVKHVVDQSELTVTPSIGGCLYPEDGLDSSSLLRCADMALFQAKANGRGNMQWFTPQMLRQTQEKLAMGNALHRAFEGQEFDIHYQPEVSLKDGKVVGMEALLRWHRGARGDVEPDRFIPAAEENGMIVQLGEWVLLTACRECVGLQRKLGRPLTLAVNVSPRQFQRGSLLTAVQRALDESGLDPSCLELEITEGMLIRELQHGAELLGAIRKLGVTVVIDDFGTGYSSLSYLSRFPVDKIKIDRSFVSGLASKTPDAVVINAIIAMAHSLDLKVIAEGVENSAQQEYLRQRGCDEAQGYYFSKAVSAGEFAAFVAGRGN